MAIEKQNPLQNIMMEIAPEEMQLPMEVELPEEMDIDGQMAPAFEI